VIIRADREIVLRDIEAVGVVAVIRLADGKRLLEVAEALGAGGIRAIEVTMTVPGAVEIIRTLARSLPASYQVGAGTVLDSATAERVIEAGASFVVSPVLNYAVIEACRERRVAVMPGCFTPTEILSAADAGADIVKVFPATALGPGYFRDLRAPLPHLRLMPTGGVTTENAGAWIRAGAVAIGVGASLVDRQAIADRRFDVITANARQFVAAVADARPREAVKG
jgi:2-dehydro-3-deoxyphosphogluconate aldolase/(4S)-4-hydroxy-2-oxoglutarate aldolase